MISVILSGGSGTRLWPVSRNKLPKQFCEIFQESLFSQTCKRLQKFGEVQVCTSSEMKILTEKSIRQNSLNVTQSFYEPFGRNTAPAVALVCRHLQLMGKENEVLGIYPSDHWIENEEQFSKVLSLAESCAQAGQIVTIGIKPDYPATGFGYIECSANEFSSADGLKALEVKAFHEKPNLETAQSYIEKGDFCWNSGMFVFSVKTMIKAFETYMATMWSAFEPLKTNLSNLEDIYKNMEGQSLDYGIMEHVKNQVNIPCDIGWSDLGSWDDISNVKNKEALKNQATSVFYGCENNFTYSSQDKMICIADVNDLLVVDTEDVVMITKRGQSQNVKKLLNEVKKIKPMLANDHVFEHRPWGQYRNTWEEEKFKTKVIQVDPKQQLSYQSHAKRSEVWVIVEGEGEVVLNEDVISVRKGSLIEIPIGAKHRMRNNSVNPLKFVEVQQGDYFGEDDIVRYQDDYNRS